MSIAIPASTLNSSAGGSPQLIMQFATAVTAIPLSLSIGSLNKAYSFNYAAWAYSFAPYKYTHSGADLTKFRLVYSGIVAGSWVAFGPVPVGTYWITGLELSSLTWDTASGAKTASVAAGAFTDSLVASVAANTDAGEDLPCMHVVSAGEAGRTIAKLKYKFEQSVSGAGAWKGTVLGTKMYQFPT